MLRPDTLALTALLAELAKKKFAGSNLTEEPLSDVLKAVRSAPRDSLVLFIRYADDSSGSLPANEAAHLVQEVDRVRAAMDASRIAVTGTPAGLHANAAS